MSNRDRLEPAEELVVEELPAGPVGHGRAVAVVSQGGAGRAEPPGQLLRVVPVVLEIEAGEERFSFQRGYDRLISEGGTLVGLASVRLSPHGAVHLEDRWRTTAQGRLRLSRSLRASEGSGPMAIRAELWLELVGLGQGTFTSLRYLAPTLLYDKNDVNRDGLEDWLLASSVVAREDRIANRAFLAYDEHRKYGLTLRRADTPVLDAGVGPRRGDGSVISTTDVGSIGIEEAGEGDRRHLRLVGCYPFAERPHSFALLVKDSPGWRALRPIGPGEQWEWEYELLGRASERFTGAMWQMLKDVAPDLKPVPVSGRAPADEICRLRLQATSRYFVEGQRRSKTPFAGTALNCHPQDGEQLANIIQLGFTGQNVLLDFDYLRASRRWDDEAMAERARKAIDFMATEAQMGNGMLWNLYNVDTDRFSSWWGGLILPLAYADDEGVRALMGPLRDLLAPVIERLTETDGAYLRGMSEENEALIRCYEYEAAAGRQHPQWLEAAKAYGEFLVRVQDSDGGWYRAYDVNEKPLTEPAFWFGREQAELKCSTAMPVPFLVRLAQ